MKSSFNAELSVTRSFVVEKDRTLGLMGEEDRAYAPPSLILDIEQTCRDLIVEHADAGEDSVGMDVAVRHTAPTLPGMKVEIAAKVAAVDGRKVSFEVIACDDVEWIAEGKHTRFVVDTTKTLERLKDKAARRSVAVG
jgi:predicted thioesterase